MVACVMVVPPGVRNVPDAPLRSRMFRPNWKPAVVFGWRASVRLLVAVPDAAIVSMKKFVRLSRLTPWRLSPLFGQLAHRPSLVAIPLTQERYTLGHIAPHD